MNSKQFEEFVDGVFKRCKELLLRKGNDYADKDDVFGNFKRMSEKIKTTMKKDLEPESVCEMFKLIKIDRIHNLCDGNREPFNESVYDSYLDELNYLLLEMGIVYEKSLNKKKQNE